METPRFLADAMLGRLARWLRALGHDVVLLPSDAPDVRLVERADREHRILLTRDRHLLRELRPCAALEIVSDVPIAQLRQVVEALGLAAPPELFTRCLLCNTILAATDPAERSRLLPPAARGLAGPVRRCADCGRVYWNGSHARRMRTTLAQVYDTLPPIDQ